MTVTCHTLGLDWDWAAAGNWRFLSPCDAAQDLSLLRSSPGLPCGMKMPELKPEHRAGHVFGDFLAPGQVTSANK